MTKVIIVTGGIGSGKSAVCRILAGMGYTSQYDADSRVKKLYMESGSLVQELETVLRTSLRDSSGDFCPSLMAARIFSDRSALESVESIVFPALAEDFRRFVSNTTSEYVIFESATVLEKEYFSGFGDAVLFVTAPYQVRLQRAVARDNAAPDSVRARMDNQKMMNILSEKNSGNARDMFASAVRRISAVVDTDCTMEDMYERVAEAMKIIKTKLLSE